MQAQQLGLLQTTTTDYWPKKTTSQQHITSVPNAGPTFGTTTTTKTHAQRRPKIILLLLLKHFHACMQQYTASHCSVLEEDLDLDLDLDLFRAH